MRVFVIGGTGFVGSALARRMASEELWTMHRGFTAAPVPGSRALVGDRRDVATLRRLLETARPTVVIDMSATNGADADIALQALPVCVERAVLVSSGSVYRSFGVLVGSEPGPIVEAPNREDAALRTRLYPYRHVQPRPAADPRAWLNDYDKIPAERAYLAARHVSTSVVRLPMVYGPGDPDGRLDPYLRRMRDRRPAILLRRSCACWRNSRTGVDSAAAAIARVAERGRAGNVYNVSDPDDATEQDWIESLGRLYGWSGRVLSVPDDADPRLRPSIDELPLGANYAQHLRLDGGRIRAELGHVEPVERSQVLAACIAQFDRSPRGPADYAQEDALLAHLGA